MSQVPGQIEPENSRFILCQKTLQEQNNGIQNGRDSIGVEEKPGVARCLLTERFSWASE